MVLSGATLLSQLLVAATSLTPLVNARVVERSGNGPRLGAVASESAICSKIGTKLLQDGGNAVDALVGTVFCIGTVNMYHSGIGGGGFVLVRTPDGQFENVDFRETAPAAAFQDMYRGNQNGSSFGGLASGVPGELRGNEYLHKKYGKLPWAKLVMPSVQLARNGFPVTQDLLNAIAQTPGNSFFTEDPNWAQDFAPNGRLVRLNETMTRKRYADTLETIANEGPDAFYTGPIAEATIEALQAANGTMTLEDLKNYTVAIRQPLSIQYRGLTLTSTNAPSSGPVALSALNALSGYHDFKEPSRSKMSTHLMHEAIKFAYGQRTQLGDPSFISGMANYTNQMISAATGAETRAKIFRNQTFGPEYYNPEGYESLPTPGTSHVASIDSAGFSASMTTTINLYFGSQVLVKKTGIIMNNEMDDFSSGYSNAFGFISSPNNYIKPGARPVSSISPIIATNKKGELVFALGCAGGSRITTANIQNTIHLVDGKMTTMEALAQPRLHDQLMPAQVTFEYAYNNKTVSYLQQLGNNVTWVAPGLSSAQAVRRLPSGVFEAAGEPRQKASGGFAV